MSTNRSAGMIKPSMWRRKLSRRQVLKASAKAGAGAAALGVVGAASAADTPRQLRVPDDAVIQRGGHATASFVGPSSGNPPTLDPYENLTYRSQIQSGYHYSRLIRPVSAGPNISPVNSVEFESDLASLPEVIDATMYVFRLNPQARWHDVHPLNGRRVTASDVEQTYQRFQAMHPNAAGWNAHVHSLEAIGQTITIRTREPYAPLLGLISSGQHLWIIPPEIVDDDTVSYRPVGSGAWIFEEHEQDVALRWRRNPHWHGAGPSRLPYLDRFTATMNGDPNVLIAALGDESLDFSQLSHALYEQARQAVPEAQFVFTPNTVPGGFYFNFSIPPWNDIRVRQALSLAMDRDAILDATDPTGHGGWQSALAQLEPFALNPRNLEEFGETFEGELSGKLFHRDLAEARKLLDAAGYPEGIQATLHGTADYGTTVVNLYEACSATAAEAGFQFEFFFKEYAAYIASIFRGNFPDDWDGVSSHLAIGPMYGGAVDPEDILSAVYARDSGRHNWGAAGRVSWRSVTELDTGGNAGHWSHPRAARGGGPESDQRLHDMIERQRGILDYTERREYVDDIQRYLATKMYIVPYIATPGVYAYQPYMRYRDYDSMHIKSTYGAGQEFLPGLWMSPSVAGIPTGRIRYASDLLRLLGDKQKIWLFRNGGWAFYDGTAQSTDFDIQVGDLIWIAE